MERVEKRGYAQRRTTEELHEEYFNAELEAQLYQIEEFKDVPPQHGGRISSRRAFFIDFCAKIEGAGFRFVIRKSEEHTLKQVLKTFYPEWKVRITKIEGNEGYKRVYRIA